MKKELFYGLLFFISSSTIFGGLHKNIVVEERLPHCMGDSDSRENSEEFADAHSGEAVASSSKNISKQLSDSYDVYCQKLESFLEQQKKQLTSKIKDLRAEKKRLKEEEAHLVSQEHSLGSEKEYISHIIGDVTERKDSIRLQRKKIKEKKEFLVLQRDAIVVSQDRLAEKRNSEESLDLDVEGSFSNDGTMLLDSFETLPYCSHALSKNQEGSLDSVNSDSQRKSNESLVSDDM